MSEIKPEHFEEAIDNILSGSYKIESRSVIEVAAGRHNLGVYPFALNEVAVLKQDISSMIKIRVFINDEYLSWDVTYYMNGNLLNRLPLIKKLKWREVFGFRGLWGHLTDKNNPRIDPEGLYRFPATTHEMSQTPYMEASVGIENILKFLRIDYVWRLTYLEHPNIQKGGVRMTMVLSF